MTGLQEGGAYGPQCVCMLQASVFVSAFSAAHSRVLWSGGFLAFSCAVPKAEGGTGPQVETLAVSGRMQVEASTKTHSTLRLSACGGKNEETGQVRAQWGAVGQGPPWLQKAAYPGANRPASPELSKH